MGKTSTFSSSDKLKQYKDLFDINFFSLVSVIAYATPFLSSPEGKEQAKDGINGRIIMTSSGAATGGSEGWGAYRCLSPLL